MIPLGDAANLLGFALIAALGVAVLALARRSPAGLALATFSIGVGGARLLGRWRVVDGAPDLLVLASAAFWWAALFGVAAMAFVFPTPLGRSERRLLAAPLAILVAGAVTTMLYLPAEARSLSFVPGALLTTLMVAVAALFALRAQATSETAAQRQFGLASTALLILPAIVTSPFSSAPYEAWTDRLHFAVILLLAGLWLYGGTRQVDARLARNSAWSALGLAFAGMLVGAPSVSGRYGLIMLATVALLAHGILRHRLLGFDVKLRWTLSKSTVAAVFVAVFFVASETAQVVLGDTIGSTYAGIAAAGALVFAIAPLQRAAERLAERAVPVATGPREDWTAESDYRAAVRMTLRDGAVSREGERALLRLAERAGIPASRALAIHEEVEREAAP